VTVVAFCFTAEEFVSSFGCRSVKINSGLWRWSGNSELIEMKLRQFLRYAILIGRNVRQIGESIRSGDRKLGSIV
jgi:hypothetical protein